MEAEAAEALTQHLRNDGGSGVDKKDSNIEDEQQTSQEDEYGR